VDDSPPLGPVPTRASYPQIPNVNLPQPESFNRYDTSTLFDIFFDFAGTAQQFFVARELKRCFHTKYQAWFRRIAELIKVTPGHEICTFESLHHKDADAWEVRHRNSFKLESEYVAARIVLILIVFHSVIHNWMNADRGNKSHENMIVICG
jgi:CCR4-NOT transcriptional regulation complex NOT5 subunit